MRPILHPRGVKWSDEKVDTSPYNREKNGWRCVYSPEIKAWNRRMRIAGAIGLILSALAIILTLAK